MNALDIFFYENMFYKTYLCTIMPKTILDGMIYWSRKPMKSNIRNSENSQRSFLQPKEPQELESHAVEATSYALLVFLKKEGVTLRQERIVAWLTSVRDWNNAFTGTVVS